MASTKKPRHGEIAARLVTFLKQAVRPGQRLLLGFSGGLDSCVLLHLLASLRDECRYELAALHVNHGISTRADEWQQFCAETCASLLVPFTAARVDVPRDTGLGIEAAARAARYAVLLAQPADILVLAHHQDDQAETLLLQLLRGAGVRGLAAMGGQRSVPSAQLSADSRQLEAGMSSEETTKQPTTQASLQISAYPHVGEVSPVPSLPKEGEGYQRPTTMLRPLLDISRATLESYASSNHLAWIEDESNLDLAYDRNFLRHHIFPELEKRFPASRITLARSAAHLAEAAALLDEVALEDASRWIRQGRLQVTGLHAMSEPRAKNLLRHWLSAYLTELPSTRRLQDIYRQLLEARAEAMIAIALEGGQVRRYRGEAWFDQSVSLIQPAVLEWRGESELQFAGGQLSSRPVVGAGISLARLDAEPLYIHWRQGGERLRLHRHGPARSLKNLFQEAGVPAWQRATLPLIYWRDELVCVPGIGVACEWQADAGESGLVIEWRRG